MKTVLSVIMVILILSLLGGLSLLKPVRADVKLVDQITDSTAKELKDEYNLNLIGTGSQMMNEIEMLMMAFTFYEEVDIETGRKLVVEATEKYLSAINTNEKIRPYLHHYPFTAENVQIVIHFYNPDGSNIALGKCESAAARRGKITYNKTSPDRYTLIPIREEPYVEALQLVKEPALKESDIRAPS